MLVPATALRGPSFATMRSAEGVSVTELVAVLSAGSGSRAPAGTVTVTVLTSRPVAFAASRPVTAKVASSPASSETVAARLSVPEAAAQVQAGATSATGNTSVTLAAVTGLGPVLVTTMV